MATRTRTTTGGSDRRGLLKGLMDRLHAIDRERRAVVAGIKAATEVLVRGERAKAPRSTRASAPPRVPPSPKPKAARAGRPGRARKSAAETSRPIKRGRKLRSEPRVRKAR